MHSPYFERICLLALCLLAPAAAAQDGLRLRTQPNLLLIPPDNRDEVPLFIDADRIEGHNERETDARGDVRLRRRGQAVFAARLRYDKPTDQVTAEGSVRIEQGPDTVEGSYLTYNLATETGHMDNPRYTLAPRGADAPPGGSPLRFTDADARGRAERLLFEGAGRYRVQQGEYTTCEPGNDSWFIRARDLLIEKDRDEGVARDARIVFKGQTILYSPYLSFSLHQQRKSGFLTPHYGNSNKSGFELTVPFYWNIAPNYDATIAPRLLTKRGLMLNNELRYLQPDSLGEARFEILPNDQQKEDGTRYALALQHRQNLWGGWLGTVNYRRVSDNTYFTDLSTQISQTSQVLLPREGSLSRGGAWGRSGSYGFTAQIQQWQTLQADPKAPVTPPYAREPQLTLTASNRDVFYSDFDFLGSFISFGHPTLVNGKRLVAYPTMSLPLQTASAFVTPKAGLHLTHYALDDATTTLPDSNRAVPIFTATSGVVFERDATIGKTALLQTLEPSLYYVYIPFRNQTQIPNFDSGLQDINFATIFSENQFSGQDRINDANQVTVGISSRLISPDNGAERLRLGIAQRFYFQSQQVTLPGVPPRSPESARSDLLFLLSGTVAPRVTADVGWQYNEGFSQTQKFNIGARYQPQPGKVLNAVYRYTYNSIEQTDFSTQWPVSSGLTALARWNYSMRDGRTLEALAGIEYNGGCWALRVVGHRFATATSEASTSIFIQLELNGVSRLGSNPLDVLRRNIGGYTRVDPRAPAGASAPGVW